METQELVRALAALPAATLYEGMGKVGAVHHPIRPICPGSRLAGLAYTIRILPGETSAVLRAIEEAPAGSVLVIDTGGNGESAVWGGTSSLASSVRGLAGCVTNGLVRDIDEIIEIGLPVYAAGITVTGTIKNHPGWVGLPVAVGGQRRRFAARAQALDDDLGLGGDLVLNHADFGHRLGHPLVQRAVRLAQRLAEQAALRVGDLALDGALRRKDSAAGGRAGAKGGGAARRGRQNGTAERTLIGK